jgi:hypothetical protein
VLCVRTVVHLQKLCKSADHIIKKACLQHINNWAHETHAHTPSSIDNERGPPQSINSYRKDQTSQKRTGLSSMLGNLNSSWLYDLFKRLPIVTMVVLCQESINVRRLKRSNVGDIQTDEFRRNIIVNRIDQLHLA